MNKVKKLVLFVVVICAVGTIKITTMQKNIAAKQTIFVMGDSKSSYYSKKKYSRRGWVQQFIPMLKNTTKVHAERSEQYKKYSHVVRYNMDQYTIENWSLGGISCKTFYQSGRFVAMLDQVKKNDYVIIALQHNDKKQNVGEKVADYRNYLIYFTQQIQKKGAKVLARIIAVDLQANHQIPILNRQFKQNTEGLYKACQSAAVYKDSKQYTVKTWKHMIIQRNNAWKILYTSNVTDKQCKQAEVSLKRSLKGLRRKHG